MLATIIKMISFSKMYFITNHYTAICIDFHYIYLVHCLNWKGMYHLKEHV